MSLLSESPECECGKGIEDNFHYFWVCPNYMQQRLQLFLDLANFGNLLDLNTLLGKTGTSL